MNLQPAAARTRRPTFTLVESVIATGLTLIVLASATSLLSFNLLATQVMDARKATSNIAKNRIETLRALTLDELGTAQEAGIRVNEIGVPDAAGWFLRTTVVGAEYWGSRDVTVTVVCEKKYRRPELSVSIHTIIMNQQLMIMGN